MGKLNPFFGWKKEGRFLCFLLFMAVGTSCEKNEEFLPNQFVHLLVNLDDARYNNLSYLGGFYEFKMGDPTLPIGSALGNGGILLVSSLSPIDPSEPYAAYDLYCTYEKNVCVQAQAGGLKAICPQCKSEYDIASGMGICISGPNEGKGLERYKAILSGRTVQVTRR